MVWSVEFSETATRQLRKLDKLWKRKIRDYLEDEVVSSGDPRGRGKAVIGDKQGLWRYRVGDYRVICRI